MPRFMPKTKPKDLLNPKRKALPRRAKERRSSFRSLPRPLKPRDRDAKNPTRRRRERRAIGPVGSFRSLPRPRPLPPPKPLPKLT